jgi:hypothetical protein
VTNSSQAPLTTYITNTCTTKAHRPRQEEFVISAKVGAPNLKPWDFVTPIESLRLNK